MQGVTTWPAEFSRQYRERGFWAGETLGDAFCRSVARFGPRIAVVDRERSVTYEELGRHVHTLAGHLVEREICAGERVIFQLPNVLEFVIAYFACLRVGAIPVCCHPHHRHAEISPLTDLVQPRAWFVAAEFRGFDYRELAEEVRLSAPSIREVWVVGEQGSGTASFAALLAAPSAVTDAQIAERRPGPSDVAVFQLSGGTTGVPKVIARMHDDYLYASRQALVAKSVDESSVCLLPVPLAHNMSLAAPGLQGSLIIGARVVLSISPSVDSVFPLIERERITWMPAVPATIILSTEAAARARVDFSSLRSIYVGGQRLQPEAARAAIAAFGPVVRQNYGMAEGLGCATREGDPPDVHVLYQGRALSVADEFRVLDESGNELPHGEIGELVCRGPTIVRGYYRAEEANAIAFTPEGFLRTGDMVRMTPDGYVIVEGRSKDLINRGGEKISADEIENLLLRMPAVRNVAVVAVPDPLLGERACACVVLAPGETLTLDGIASFLAEQRIAKYKMPEQLEIFEKLPETGVGKVSKKELRAVLGRRG